MITDAAVYNARRDALSYPPIPEDATRFAKGYGYETAIVVYGWEWSTTFGKWGAVVLFADGTRVYTYPEPTITKPANTPFCGECGDDQEPLLPIDNWTGNICTWCLQHSAN